MRYFLLFLFLCSVGQTMGQKKKASYEANEVMDIAKLMSLDTVTIKYQEGQYNYRLLNHNTFKTGEFLRYSLRVYGFKIGEMTFEILPDEYIRYRKTMPIRAIFTVNSFISIFSKVRDTLQTWVDREAFIPLKYYEGHHEGSYVNYITYNFYPEDSVAFIEEKKPNKKPKKKMFEVPNNAQDLLSLIYYCRLADISKMQKNSIYKFDAFFDGNTLKTGIIYEGREVVKTKKGKIRTVKIVPLLYSGVEIDRDYKKAFLYISEDKNKIPIRAEMKIPPMGFVSMELVEYRNNKWEINYKKKRRR